MFVSLKIRNFAVRKLNNNYPFHDVGKNRFRIMGKRISKQLFLLNLAIALTTCRAHIDDSHPYHAFVVLLAHVIWAIYGSSHHHLDSNLLGYLKREIEKL